MGVIPIVVVAVLVVVAVVISTILSRRDGDAPEQGASWVVPTQLDRADFERPEAPWMVVVFSSSTCDACRGTVDKAMVLEAPLVAVQSVDAAEDKALHQRYKVDAVPMVLIADASGLVHRSFVGEPSATDLWAAVAELREPGSVPAGCGDACSGDRACGSGEHA